MEPMDLFALIFGLVWVTGMLILLMRSKSKARMWPRIFGIGAGVYMFISSMTFSMFLKPISEFVDYTLSNILSSLAFGVIGYVGGRIIVRRARNKNDSFHDYLFLYVLFIRLVTVVSLETS